MANHFNQRNHSPDNSKWQFSKFDHPADKFEKSKNRSSLSNLIVFDWDSIKIVLLWLIIADVLYLHSVSFLFSLSVFLLCFCKFDNVLLILCLPFLFHTTYFANCLRYITFLQFFFTCSFECRCFCYWPHRCR